MSNIVLEGPIAEVREREVVSHGIPIIEPAQRGGHLLGGTPRSVATGGQAQRLQADPPSGDDNRWRSPTEKGSPTAARRSVTNPARAGLMLGCSGRQCARGHQPRCRTA